MKITHDATDHVGAISQRIILTVEASDAIAAIKAFKETLGGGLTRHNFSTDWEFEEWRRHALQAHIALPLSEWHEDYGAVLWWSPPITEPPYAGTPNDSDWPGYHTHWSPIYIPANLRDMRG